MAEPATRHLTILLTDIKGFTDKTSHKSRAEITAMLDEHRVIVLPILEARGGRLIKTIGDAFLMIFESPTNAVLAGVAVQDALAKRNKDRPEAELLEIRIAVNAGEVNVIDGDVFGEAVNITARIEGIAEAGQVYFTEAVYLAMNKPEVPSSEVGLVILKGIPEKVRVYKVRKEEPSRVDVSAAAHAPAREREGPRAKAVFDRPTPAAAIDDPPRPSLARRAAALTLDVALCALLVGVYVAQRTRVVSVPHIVMRKGPLPPPPSTTDPAPPNIGVGDQLIRNIASAFKGSHPPARKRVAPMIPTIVYERTTDRPWRSAAAGAAVLWFAYNLLFFRLSGATPGKIASRLKVVGLDGAPLTARQSALRALVAVPALTLFALGYAWACFDPQRRGWPDLAAGTRVASA
jgi:class 3 adenylate cyclase/uncharacterized RDD family membrane protein YckC